MLVKWEEKEFTLDLDEMTVAQAKVIKIHCQLTLMSLVNALREGDPDALRAAFWLMHAQSGVPCNIDRIDFVIVKFLNAITEASKAETDAKVALEPESSDEDPKDE